MKKDQSKTKSQLIEELRELRKRVEVMERLISQRESEVAASPGQELDNSGFCEWLPVGYQSLDEEARICAVNTAWTELTGYSEAEAIGRWFGDFVVAEQRKRLSETFEIFKKTGKVRDVEWSLNHADGSRVIVNLDGKIGSDAGGAVRMHCIVKDTTGQRQAEADLREIQKNYRLISENIPVVVYSALPDKKSTNLFVSGRMEELTGYTGKEFVQDPGLFDRMLHPDDRERSWQAIQTHRREKVLLDVEYRIVSKAGDEKWVHDRARPSFGENGEIVRIDGYMEDITARKHAEERLALEHYKLHQYFENLPLLAYNISADGSIKDLNNCAVKTLGYDSKEELIGRSVIELYAPSSRDKAKALLKKWKKKGKLCNEELQIVTKDGKTLDVLLNADTISAPNGDDLLSLSTHLDISDRKQALASLADREEKLRLVLSNTQDLISIADARANTLWANAAWRKKVGHEGKRRADPFKGLHPADRERVASAWQRLVNRGKEIQNLEYRFRTDSGDYLTFETAACRLQIPGEVGPHYLVVAHDISARVLAEQATRLRERALEASGNGMLITGPTEAGNPTVYCNPAFEKLTGYTSAEIVGRNNRFLQGVETGQPGLKEVRAGLSAGREVRTVLRNYRKDGQMFWNRLVITPVKDETGKVTNFVGIMEDISEQMHAEEERTRLLHDLSDRSKELRCMYGLLESIHRHKSMEDVAREAVALIPAAFQYPESACSRIRLAGAEYRSQRFEETEWRLSSEIIVGGEERGTVEVYYTDEHPELVEGPFLEEERQLVDWLANVLSEAAERQKADTKVAYQARLLDSVGQSVIATDAEGTIRYLNKAAEELFGWPADEAVGRNVMDVTVPGTGREQATQTMGRLMNGRSWSGEFICRNRDGTEFPVIVTDSPIINDDGQLAGIIGVSTDITERRRAEEEIAKSEQKYRSLIEKTGAGVAIVNLKGKFTYVNDSLCKMIGYSKAEMIGKAFAGFLHPGDKKKMMQIFLNTFKKPRQRVELDFKGIHKKGHEVYMNSIPTVFIHNGKVLGFTAIITDTTVRRKAEEKLRKNEMRLKEAQRIGATGDWEFDVETQEYSWSEEVYRLFERDPAQGPLTFEQSMAYFYPEDSRRLQEQVRRAVELGEGSDSDYHLELPSAGSVYHRVRIRVVKGRDGRVTKLYGTVHDITERTHDEEEIKKFKTIADKAGYGVEIFDLEGNLLYLNQNFAQMHGYTTDELLGKNLSILHNEEQMKIVNRLIELLSIEGSYVAEEVWHKRKDDTIFPTQMNGTLIRDGKGTPHFVAATAIDITERKRTEEALRESEERYRHLFERAPFGIGISTLDGKVIEMNRAMELITGYSIEDFKGSTLADTYVNPNDRAELLRTLETSGSIVDYSTLLKRKDGTQYNASLTIGIVNIAGRNVFQTLTQDITERKQYEAMIQYERDRAQEYLDISGVIFLAIDCKGMITLVNRKGCEILGFAREEILGKSWFDDFIPSDERSRVKAIVEQLMAGKAPLPEYYENRIVTASGDTRQISWHITVLKDPQDRIVGTLSSGADVTEARAFEQSLRASEQKYRMVVESTPDAVMLFEAESSRILDVNDAACQLYGYQREELLGTRQGALSAEPEKSTLSISDTLTKSHIQIPLRHHKKKDGTVIPVEISGSTFTTGGKQVLCCIVRDISDRQHTEQELRELSKQLARLQEAERTRIAQELHDRLGQSLTALSIFLTAERNSRSDGGPNDSIGRLDGCLELTETLGRYTEDLMSELRPPMLDDFGLVSALRWFSERFKTLTGVQVEVEAGEMHGRLGQEAEIGLFRIVQEALTNVARHAEATSVRIGVEPTPEGTTLSIRDDGKGFAQPGSDRRKEQRHWGLAIMRERARAAGGQLFVESEPGKGTCITVKVRAGGKHDGAA